MQVDGIFGSANDDDHGFRCLRHATGDLNRIIQVMGDVQTVLRANFQRVDQKGIGRTLKTSTMIKCHSAHSACKKDRNTPVQIGQIGRLP